MVVRDRTIRLSFVDHALFAADNALPIDAELGLG
jgi:hypothetical protein